MKSYLAVIAGTLAILVTPASGQEYSADPAANTIPEDVTAVQAPWGRTNIEASHKDRLYVSDIAGSDVCAVDPVSVRLVGCLLAAGGKGGLSSATGFGVEAAPLVATRNGRLLAWTRDDPSGVVISSTATNATVATLPSGLRPDGMTFTPDGGELWIASDHHRTLAIFETRTFREVAQLAVDDGPISIAMSPDGRTAFVSSSGSPQIHVIDVRKRIEIAKVEGAEPGARGLALTPDGKDLWAVHESGGIDVFSTKSTSRPRRSVDTGGGVDGLTFAHVLDTSFAYVASTAASTIEVFDTDSLRKVASIPLEAAPGGVWPSGDGTAVFVALPSVGKVVKLDTAHNRVASTLAVPIRPRTVVYVPGAVHRASKGPGLIAVEVTESSSER